MGAELDASEMILDDDISYDAQEVDDSTPEVADLTLDTSFASSTVTLSASPIILAMGGFAVIAEQGWAKRVH